VRVVLEIVGADEYMEVSANPAYSSTAAE
jgi:hypothetical protein